MRCDGLWKSDVQRSQSGMRRLHARPLYRGLGQHRPSFYGPPVVRSGSDNKLRWDGRRRAIPGRRASVSVQAGCHWLRVPRRRVVCGDPVSVQHAIRDSDSGMQLTIRERMTGKLTHGASHARRNYV